MNKVNEMPESGQFVMTWKYNDLPWSQTMRWVDGVLFVYNQNSDDWEEYEAQLEAEKTYYI